MILVLQHRDVENDLTRVEAVALILLLNPSPR